MTDVEIIKALERCGNLVDSRCKECPYHMAYNASCVVSVMRDTLDLIDRKTEEICVLYDALESEQYKVHELSEERDKLLKECKKCGRKHGRKVSRLQKEIERLKLALSVQNTIDLTKPETVEEVAKYYLGMKHMIKSDAYREFAERLKEKAWYDETDDEYVIYKSDICDVLDELIGE